MKQQISLTRIARCPSLLILISFTRFASAQAQITPFVDCIERVDDSNYRAHFGYVSYNTTNITIPVNTPRNYFTPIPSPPGQPSVFLPGVHHRVVSMVLPLDINETWFIGNNFVNTNAQTLLFPCSDAGGNTRTITYQGRLNDGANAANGNYDLRFQLFDAVSSGASRSATLALEDVSVVNGVFTAQLDFGLLPAILDGGNLYLEIAVRPGASTGTYTTLAPRQPLTATPYAIRAQSAANADLLGGLSRSDFILSKPISGQTIANDLTIAAASPNFGSGNLTVAGTISGNGANLTNLNASNIASGTLDAARIPNLDANKITSGMLADGRLSLNIATLAGEQTFTGAKTFSGGIALDGGNLRFLTTGDNNNRIFYTTDINGLVFSAGDSFQWFNVRNNRTNMQLDSAGNLSIVGSYGQFSDARLKTNVQTLTGALDAVRRLRGVNFNWINDRRRAPQTQIGFIAQEVEAVLPELVSTDKEGYKTVSYSNAVPVLVEAVKEQNAQIERQQQQINELKQIVCAIKPDAAVCKEEK